jgi:VIT1/CCC1 family predicted Fe2+/Mn2+ transporter
MWRRVTMAEDDAARRFYARIIRLEFWRGWIWGVVTGLAVAFVSYFIV